MPHQPEHNPDTRRRAQRSFRAIYRRVPALAAILRTVCRPSAAAVALLGVLALLLAPSLYAQQGDGAIHGTISDKSGAVIRNAKVTATNTDTGVQMTRTTNGDGDYTLGPLQAGHYNIEVVAKGFQRLLQEDVTLDQLQTMGLNMKLTVGADTQTITVTTAPPMLDTQDGSIGGTIENELYTDLPLSMGGAPRDPTAFSFLMPGVQEDTGSATGTATTGVYGGSGQAGLNENYVEGMPVTNISGQGDPTPVRNAVSVDAVDQFQVKTNGASTGFGGVGVTNYTIKAGGNALHGTVFDYVRNTLFDTWGYFSKVPAADGFAVKPGEHQNSYGGSLGGPIIKDKLFYFGTYEGFHYTKITNTPTYITVPTMQERALNGAPADFTDAFGEAAANPATSGITYGIFDPTSGPTRSQFQGLLNGVPTYNVINPSEISPISQYLASALPPPTNTSTALNYLAGLPLENQDYTIDARLDYTISARNKFSVVGVGGAHGYGGFPAYKSPSEVPLPYANAVYTNKKTASGVLTHTFVASQTVINTLKYGFSRTWGESFAPTDNSAFTAAKAGIGNLPSGNASNTFPGISFSQGEATGEFAPSGWGGNADSGAVATNTYTIIDNLQWIKGRHNITFGAQIQWLETNAGSFSGFSGNLALTYSGYDTADTNNSLHGGSAYASYLIGVVYTGNVRTQLINDVGGRYRPMAPYIQDDWRITPRLTLNLGLRYDYLQPYHEVKNRISFVNPSVINPIVGLPGVVMYAGYTVPNLPGTNTPNQLYAPYICHCHSPVTPDNRNLEPRLGFAFAARQNTVIRGSFGIMTTHAGGAGGGTAATAGTGNNSEFNAITAWSQTGSTGLPAFFLTNASLAGAPVNSICAPGNTNQCTNTPQADYASVPGWNNPANNVNPLGTTGNYNIPTGNPYSCDNPVTPATPQNPSASGVCNSSTQNYADPHYGAHGPQFVNWNIGIQQMINNKAVLAINYAGSQTHFLPGGAGRGLATNTISPDYAIPLNTLLTDQVASLNTVQIAQIQSLLPASGIGINLSNSTYPNGTSFAGSNATVFRALSQFPQFQGFTDLWGETGNSNYNSMQVSIIQRPWHNLSGFVNYTWSKSIDDTGNHRTQYPVGPQDGNFTRFYKAGGVDRSLGTYNQTNGLNATWNYAFPIGRGQRFFGTNRLISAIGGGWELSGIYKYRDGTPLQIREASCETATDAGQGTCMPDMAPGFTPGSARINGRWGHGTGANASNIQNIQYLNSAAFQYPDLNSATFKLGNETRSAPYGLTGPGWWDIDAGIRRTFNILERPSAHLTFQLEADVINVTNSTFFVLASAATTWGTCPAGATVSTCSQLLYGTVGGQNGNVPPRDWQFAGRFRF